MSKKPASAGAAEKPAVVAPRSRPASVRAKAERSARLIERLALGASMSELALQEGVSERRMRRIVQEMFASGELVPPPGFAQSRNPVSVARSSMLHDLRVLERVLKIVRAFDRYRGFSAAPAPRALCPKPRSGSGLAPAPKRRKIASQAAEMVESCRKMAPARDAAASMQHQRAMGDGALDRAIESFGRESPASDQFRR